MSESLTDLATFTNNASWLDFAALFERPCFVRPLMLDYQRNQEAQPSAVSTSSLAATAIERMHANTHIPQLLGAMVCDHLSDLVGYLVSTYYLLSIFRNF